MILLGLAQRQSPPPFDTNILPDAIQTGKALILSYRYCRVSLICFDFITWPVSIQFGSCHLALTCVILATAKLSEPTKIKATKKLNSKLLFNIDKIFLDIRI
jgi:hypothetical protein